MRALLSTNHMLTWSGSELTVLDLCESLRRRDFEVTVYANHWQAELRTSFESVGAAPLHSAKGVRVFDFDFAWFQHHTAALFDLALHETSRERSLLVFVHLSPFQPLEYPGFVVESATSDLVLCNSEETRAAVIDARLKEKRHELFQNPAPEAFFDQRRSEWSSNLRRVCVVSNHAPPEVRDALAILREHHGVECTSFGIGGDTVERVTPQLLAGFDAVVSIGKTVQYALAMQMPVYCYDRFGGPGYLAAANHERCERFNFSGRCSDRRLPAGAIADELVNGYARAVAWARRAEVERFRLERRVDAVLATPPGANRERAAVLAQISHDVERERRVSLSIRSAFVDQFYYQREALELRASAAEKERVLAAKDAALAAQDAALAERDVALTAKDAALAEKEVALAAKDAALDRVESELGRSNQEVSRMKLVLERLEAEVGRQGRELEAVKAHAAQTMKLLANRVIKPTVAKRKLIPRLLTRLRGHASRHSASRSSR